MEPVYCAWYHIRFGSQEKRVIQHGQAYHPYCRRPTEITYEGARHAPAVQRVHTLVTSVLDTQITVISGAHVQSLPLVNMSVGNARHLLQASFNIGPQAMALINGRPVQPETVLQQGDTLEFVHHAGEKGGAGGGICLR